MFRDDNIRRLYVQICRLASNTVIAKVLCGNCITLLEEITLKLVPFLVVQS